MSTLGADVSFRRGRPGKLLKIETLLLGDAGPDG